MEIILLENIEHVGKFGEKVTVKPGYARNFLLPQGKATAATPENIARFEARRAELAARVADEVERVRIRAEEIRGQTITIQANAGPEGKLFGSVGPVDIAGAMQERGLSIERSEVRMPDGPIRVAGEHTVDLHLHAEFDVQITVIVDGGTGHGVIDPDEGAKEESRTDGVEADGSGTDEIGAGDTEE